MADTDAILSLSQRERFFRALARRQVDRAPVICTGGSMTATPAEVMERRGFSLPGSPHRPRRDGWLASPQPAYRL